MTMNHERKIADLRREYSKYALDIEHVYEEPFGQFREWFDEALKAELTEPNAMTLSTADKHGKPSGRIVLLKELDDKGFVFYTNYLSRKGRELAENPFAALTFFWIELERQVRVTGKVEQIPPETSDAYFKSRPVGSQYGASASPQSRPIETKQAVSDKMKQLQELYPEGNVPRPEYWGGYRLIPGEIEFWQGRPNRLHDRILYALDDSGKEWTIKRLAP